MPLLDWAEKKIDRSIISIGESCKTWFQEVWRLIARVLVFWLSILLGFLHKPSFEKWLAEQRGRIHPRRAAVDSTATSSGKQDPLESPRQGVSVGSHEAPTSPLFSAASNRSEPIAVQRSGSRDFKKRKGGRAGRTGFAELLTSSGDKIRREPSHVAHSSSSNPMISSSAPSHHQDHLLPASFRDELTSEDGMAHSYEEPNLLLDGEAEDYSTHDDIEYDQKSSTSDDYDEFYGHTKAKIVPRRKSPRPGSNHRRQASTGSHHHVFSIEGIDSATSPLLESPRDRHHGTTELSHPSPHHLPGLGSAVAHHVTTWTFTTPRDISTASPDNEANASDVYSKVLSLGLPAPSDTPPRGPQHAHDAEDSPIQAMSVPIALEPPLATETKKRSSHKRARSMSPSSASRYSVSAPGASNPFLGGTGRRGSSRLRRHDPDAPKQRYEEIDIHKDRIYTSDKLNTGALEDLRMYTLLQIDNVTGIFRRGFKALFSFVRNFSLRKLVFGTLDNILVLILSPSLLASTLLQWLWNLTFGLLILIFYLPSRLISGVMKTSSFDKRSTEAIVTSQGYPYECYEVETDDGYILKLERLSRPKSNRVIYFQHGVIDNSFAWFGHMEGEAASAAAFRAYDEGYDVFVGTFRGCEGSTRHRRKDFSSSDYWNFTVNEHGMYDLKAFIERIVSIKKSELGSQYEPINGSPFAQPVSLSESPNKFNIIIIAHSMGAMASLIYLVWSKIKKRQHNIAAAILLSPAGYHKTAPAIVHITGPIINLALWMFPWIHTLKFPGEWIRLLVSKIIEDVNNSFTGRTMISWGVAKVIGGSIEDHPFVNLRNLTYNVFSGTSTGVFRHFWQIWIHKRFEGFDYGLAKNKQIYGSLKPIDFIDNYDKLDLPIYFTMGLNDTLIEPESIIYQYVSYKNVQPNLAFLKAFPRMGHIDFTIGASEKLIEFILETLRNTCEGRTAKDDGEPDDDLVPNLEEAQ